MIEKLEQYTGGETNRYGDVIYWTRHPDNRDFMNKINELVDAANELKKRLDELADIVNELKERINESKIKE